MDFEQNPEMSQEDIAEQERLEQEQLRRERAMDRLGSTLEGRKNKAVDDKRDIEARWLRDERQYWGVNWTSDGDEDDYQVTDSKTRQKTRVVAARIGDMLFPTNDKNWKMGPTPDPKDVDGNDLDDATADAGASQVEKKIEDYLSESEYSKHGRKAILDGCRIGSGVLKGPFMRGVTKRRATRRYEPILDEFGQQLMDETGQPAMAPAGIEQVIVVESRPAAARVDPWMWFPLAARNVEECEGAFELHLYNKERMRTLPRYGFDAEQVRQIIKGDPDNDGERGLLSQRRDLLRSNAESLDSSYSVWEYHGALDREDLVEIGVEFDAEEDPLESYWGEVWFCQGRILKIELVPFVTDPRIPYYVWNYLDDEADIFGYGIPYVMRDEQMMLDSLLNAMKVNSELTAGPQSVEWKGKIAPADGDRKVRGPKHWYADDSEMKNVSEAIQFFNIPNTLDMTMPFYERVSQNADENTMMPIMAQGDATNAHQTSSGIAMLMNASNIVQRMAAHAWDDNITIPMIRRFFDWILEYDSDDINQTDVEVQARGASYLLVKDMQAQHGMMLLQLAAQDPELRAMLDMDEVYQTVISFLDVPTDRLFLTDEAKEQAAQGQMQMQQMQQQAAQAEMEDRLAGAEEKRARAQKALAEAQAAMSGGDDGSAMLEYEREAMRANAQMADIESRMIIAQMERDTALAKVAAEQNIKMADIEARFQTSAQDRDMQASIEQMRLRQKQQEADRKEMIEGYKARMQASRQQLRQRNMSMGFDSF